MNRAERSLSDMVAVHGLVHARRMAIGMQSLRPSAIGFDRVAILMNEEKFAEFWAKHELKRCDNDDL